MADNKFEWSPDQVEWVDGEGNDPANPAPPPKKPVKLSRLKKIKEQQGAIRRT